MLKILGPLLFLAVALLGPWPLYDAAAAGRFGWFWFLCVVYIGIGAIFGFLAAGYAAVFAAKEDDRLPK